MLIMVEAAMKLEFWKFKLEHIQRNIVYINEIISAVIFSQHFFTEHTVFTEHAAYIAFMKSSQSGKSYKTDTHKQTIAVRSFCMHPEWDQDEIYGDIAILVLRRLVFI